MTLGIIGFRGLLIVPPNLNLTKMFLIKDCTINCDCCNKSLEFPCLIILSALNSVLGMIKQQIEVNGIGSATFAHPLTLITMQKKIFFANQDADINKCW